MDDKKGASIPMKDSFKMAYLLINDLINEHLGFFLIEPKSVPKDIVRAIPLIGSPIEVESHYMDHFKSPKT